MGTDGSESASVAEGDEHNEENDVVAVVAVLGRQALMPAIKPLTIEGRSLLVAHAYAPSVEVEGTELKVPTEDCTIYTVTHLGRKEDFDIEDAAQSLQVLDDSLVALSESVMWERAHDQVGELSQFQRWLGRVDVKLFVVLNEGRPEVAWLNPLYRATNDVMSMMSGFLGNMIMNNGPSASPLNPDAKRIMGAVDLVNLGFFTEAFITAFALLDDVAQRVAKGGLVQRGLKEKESEDLMRGIEKRRLERYLNHLLTVSGWTALRASSPDLAGHVARINTLRNNVMHGDKTVNRAKAIDALNVIVAAIDFLRGNPFGVTVGEFPALRLAQPQLVRLQPGGTALDLN